MDSDPQRVDGPRWLRRLLLAGAVLLAAVAVFAFTTSGLRMTLGPFRFSATSGTRVCLEAATLWLLAEVIAPARRHVSVRTLAAIVTLLVVAVADSAPRRVGDGAEYIAMALAMSHGAPPAVLPDERDSLTTEMQMLFPEDRFSIEQPLVGWDGRQDFYHFWLYPLLVSPFAWLARMANVHVNYAFTLVNVLMFGGLLWWLVHTNRAAGAALIAAGPALWWIDKAHSEMFMFVTLAFAVLLLDAWPAAALIAAALAAAQNPAAAVVLAVCVVSMAVRGRASHIPILAVVAAFALAAAAPVYYHWHLGLWSPLSSTVGRDVPGIRALLTPVVDPNLGLLIYAPVLVGFACMGLTRQTAGVLMLTISAAAALLIVFAESGNVNHGGTPGMSRYALWLLALAIPLVVDGCERFRVRRPAFWRVAALASILFSLFVFRPAWPDRAGDSPNWLATALWTRWPAVDNPLPEVFAERTYGSGGAAPVPVTTSACEKVLIRGDGREAWWPLPCGARPAPPMCIAAGMLCYVNDGRYAVAPAQPTFVFEATEDHAWTSTNAARFYPLLLRLGERVRFVRLAERGGRIEDVQELEHLYVLEGSAGAAAWVQPWPESQRASVRLQVASPSTLEFLDAASLKPVGDAAALAPGLHDLPLQNSNRIIVLVTDQ